MHLSQGLTRLHQLGLQSFHTLTGGGSETKLTDKRPVGRPHGLDVCWLDTQVPCHMGLSMRLLIVQQLIFPRARAARRSKRGKSNMEVTVFYNLI